MNMRNFGYGVVVAAFLAAIAVLIPWNRAIWVQAVTTHIYTFDHPKWTPDAALKSAAERVNFLMQSRDKFTARMALDNLTFLNETRRIASQNEAVGRTMDNLARINIAEVDSNARVPRLRYEMGELQKNDPAWRSMMDPTEETWHWDILREHAGQMMPFSMLFVLVGIAGLIKLWGLPKFLEVVVCSISLLLSTAGGVVAQTVKKIQKKENTSQTLQMDARLSIFTSEGPPSPGLFLRTTNSSKRGLFQNVSTFNPRTRGWSSDIEAGLWVPKTSKLKVLAEVLYTDATKSAARLGAGIQIFRSGKRGLFAIPVLRWEHQVHGPPIHSFTAVTNPNIRLGSSRWSLAPDVGARRLQGKPWAWTVGIGLRFTPGKGKHQFETAPFTNSAGLDWNRFRFIKTMAY